MFLTVTVQVLQLFQTWKNEVTSWLLVGMFNEQPTFAIAQHQIGALAVLLLAVLPPTCRRRRSTIFGEAVYQAISMKPFELANFKLFSKVSKLKDQRNCELVSILFFLPNGTMSRFKRPQPVAPPGCGPGFRFKGFEAPAETFWWTNVSQNAGQRAAEMIVQASREAWKGTDCQAVPKSRNLSFESVKFVQIKNVRTWFEEKKSFPNQWQQIPKVWKQSDITVTLNHQSCLHSLAKRSAAFNGCLPSTCPINGGWIE